jgi:hypothetical protein
MVTQSLQLGTLTECNKVETSSFFARRATPAGWIEELSRKSIEYKQGGFTLTTRAAPQTRTDFIELSGGKANATLLCVDVNEPTKDKETFGTLYMNVERRGTVAHDPIAKVGASNRCHNLAKPRLGCAEVVVCANGASVFMRFV